MATKRLTERKHRLERDLKKVRREIAEAKHKEKKRPKKKRRSTSRRKDGRFSRR